jgi:hypothetical protein
VGKQFPHLDASHRDFIDRQRIFFAASAAPNARVNVSPRGTDAFSIIDERTVAYLDRTGSGNETAAHLKADGRLTIMFCAFDGPPNILRLYGRGEILRRGSSAYAALLESAFAGAEPAGARQIVRLRAISFRRRAAMGRRCSTIAASAPRSTIGRAPTAKRGSRSIGARRTSSASTAYRPDCSTKYRTRRDHRRFRVARPPPAT